MEHERSFYGLPFQPLVASIQESHILDPGLPLLSLLKASSVRSPDPPEHLAHLLLEVTGTCPALQATNFTPTPTSTGEKKVARGITETRFCRLSDSGRNWHEKREKLFSQTLSLNLFAGTFHRRSDLLQINGFHRLVEDPSFP